MTHFAIMLNPVILSNSEKIPHFHDISNSATMINFSTMLNPVILSDSETIPHFRDNIKFCNNVCNNKKLCNIDTFYENVSYALTEQCDNVILK